MSEPVLLTFPVVVLLQSAVFDTRTILSVGFLTVANSRNLGAYRVMTGRFRNINASVKSGELFIVPALYRTDVFDCECDVYEKGMRSSIRVGQLRLLNLLSGVDPAEVLELGVIQQEVFKG